MERIVATFLLALVYGLFRALYHPLVEVPQAVAAVGQLKDNPGTPRLMATIDFSSIASYILVIGLLIIWLPVLFRWLRNTPHLTLLILVGVTFSALVSCEPYQKPVFETIEPNETAFMIPLEGQSQAGQAQFMSEEFLQANKVATKRIEIPMRKSQIDRQVWDVQWIPTARIVKVDRTPVTREWTKATETGTSSSNQAFKVESSESIDFWVGGVASASITEEDAARFLYYFAGRSLAEVMDQNVRNQIQATLFREFGSRKLLDGQKDKGDIFSLAEREVKQSFAARGVTIQYVGGSEGLTYTDPLVQESINKKFAAAQDALRALSEKEAQITRAQGEAEYIRLRGEQLARFPQLIDLELATRYKGDVPQTMVTTPGAGVLPLIALGKQSP